VDLPGGNTNDGTVLLVELDDFEGVFAAEYDIVVEFVPGLVLKMDIKIHE
jgi:hypothetical protein